MTSDRAVLPALQREIAQLGASPGTLEERASAVLHQLGRAMPFDAGWLALRDPEQDRHLPLATTGEAQPLRDYFDRPEAVEEVELLGMNRRRPPVLAQEIPLPLSEVRAWSEHLIPAGFRAGLATGLFTSTGRHVGFLSLLSADPSRPGRAERRAVAAVSTSIADALDRVRDIAETAGIVRRARSGVVLTRAGDVLPLPGLPDDRLLAPGSPVLDVAADELARSGTHVSFLASVAGGREGELARVVALDVGRPDLDHLSAAVLLCPAGDLLGLTVVDLVVLGLLVEGVTDVAALARSLRLPDRAVADALVRGLAALQTDDVTAAAVRALRRGLRIPVAVSAGS